MGRQFASTRNAPGPLSGVRHWWRQRIAAWAVSGGLSCRFPSIEIAASRGLAVDARTPASVNLPNSTTDHGMPPVVSEHSSDRARETRKTDRRTDRPGTHSKTHSPPLLLSCWSVCLLACPPACLPACYPLPPLSPPPLGAVDDTDRVFVCSQRACSPRREGPELALLCLVVLKSGRCFAWQ